MRAEKALKENGRTKVSHMDHSTQIPRLRRVRGQLDGIEKMITDQRYCTDILHQIKAARSALGALEAAVLESHLRGCVRSAILSKDQLDAERKINEIMDLFGK